MRAQRAELCIRQPRPRKVVVQLQKCLIIGIREVPACMHTLYHSVLGCSMHACAWHNGVALQALLSSSFDTHTTPPVQQGETQVGDVDPVTRKQQRDALR